MTRLPVLTVRAATRIGQGHLGPAGGVVVLAVALGAWWLTGVLHRVWLRRSAVRRLTLARPDLEPVVRAAARAALPTWRSRRTVAPADPGRLDVPVVVAPLGDGRPGERFRAPVAAGPTAGIGPDGSRQDALVRLGEGVALIVVCLGRVGPADGRTIETAELRPHRSRAALPAGLVGLDEVVRLDTAAGPAWRHTFGAVPGRSCVTDVHLDHGGWAFVVGLRRPVGWRGADELLSGVLASWQWLPDDGREPPA